MFETTKVIFLSWAPNPIPADSYVSSNLCTLVEKVFFKAMVNGDATQISDPKFLEVVEAIKKAQAYFLDPNTFQEKGEKSIKVRGLYALLRLLEISWKLDSHQMQPEEINSQQLKVTLVHAYHSKHVDYFLDVIFALAVKFSSVYYFETAKVLRALYLERLITFEQDEKSTKRIEDPNVFLHKSKIKWFALELENFEHLWRQNENSEFFEEFEHKDAPWSMQSLLSQLKIVDDCPYDILRDYEIASKHFNFTQKLCNTVAKYCECTKDSSHLDPFDGSFDKEFKNFMDLVLLKSQLMEATNYEILSLYEEDLKQKCAMLLKTITMMMGLKQDVIAVKAEKYFFVMYKDRLVKVFFSLVETQSVMLLNSDIDDMMIIRNTLNKSIKQFQLHATSFDKILDSRAFAGKCLKIRSQFYKLMLTFYTIYDYNVSKIKYFYDKSEKFPVDIFETCEANGIMTKIALEGEK